METFRFDYKNELDYEYDFLETFRFDNEYEFDYQYDFLVRPNSLTGVCNTVVGSNLVAVLQFTTIIAKDLVINITSSKAKKTHS